MAGAKKRRDRRRTSPAEARQLKDSLDHAGGPVEPTHVLEQILYGLFFLLLAVSFSTSLQSQFTLSKVAWFRIFVPLLALSWMYRVRTGSIKSIPRPIFLCAVTLGAWWFFTTLFALHKPTALNGFYGRYNGLWNQAFCMLLFLLISSSAVKLGQIERILKLFIAALIPVSGYAIAQYFDLDPIAWPRGRSASTIGHPVILAATLGLGLPFILTFLLQAGTLIRKAIWGTILLIVSLAAVTTLARGPWIAIVFSLLLVLAWAYRDRRLRFSRAAIVAVLLSVGAVLSLSLSQAKLSSLVDRVVSITRASSDNSVRVRLIYYSAALEITRDHPIVGVGFESFPLIYPRYRPVEGAAITGDVIPSMVHNGYLQTAVTSGIPGLIFWLAFLASVLFALLRRIRASAEGEKQVLCVAFLASIAGYLIQDLSGWQEVSLSAFFWVILGLAVSLSTVGEESAKRLDSGSHWIRYAVGTAVLVSGLLLFVRTRVEMRVDSIMMRSRNMDTARHWRTIESNLETITDLIKGNAHYMDQVGVLYLQRVQASGDSEAYERGAAMLDEAHRLNAYDPYILIHRIDLESIALQRKIIEAPSERVVEASSTVVAMDPNNPTAHGSAARLNMEWGRLSEALRLAERARELRPQNARFHVLEGDIRRSLGDRSGAIATYRQGRGRMGAGTPEWISVQHKLILNLIETGEYALALALAQRVLESVPENPTSYMLLGMVYLSMKDLDEARQSFETALRLQPGIAGARQGLEQVERELRQDARHDAGRPE